MNAENSAPVAEEQAEMDGQEDQRIDTLESALDALGDDETPEEQPAETEEEEAEESEEQAVIELPDGTKVTLEELQRGYFRTKDYTHKTTEVANERKALESTRTELEERTKVIGTAMQRFSTYLQGLVPPEPSLALAQSKPDEYIRQMATRQNVIAELQSLMDIKESVDEHRAAVTRAEEEAFRAREESALIRAMPALADPGRRATFDANIRNAAKAFGFSEEEIGATVDSRVKRLVHYAALGMKAEENRKNAAKKPETPRESRPKTGVPVNVDNKKALHRLEKSGSLRDALSIDF